MEILEYTVTASCVKQYQTFKTEIKAVVSDDAEMEQLKQIAINQAVDGCDKLLSTANIQTTEKAQVQTTVQSKPANTAPYQTGTRQYSAPRATAPQSQRQ